MFVDPPRAKGGPLEVQHRVVPTPFFSVCIPQYNRTSFLIEVCRSLAAQQCRDFEVCISDDCSTDGREAEILDFLYASNLAFAYRRQAENTGYDGNLRSAIRLAGGRFCFLLGNDDAMASPSTLETLRGLMAAAPDAAVVFTNFEDYRTGRVVSRVKHSGIVGTGPGVAAACFRRFSFVGGVVLRTDRAQAAATTRWDGSEMYQMWVGCRLIAEGGTLLEVDLVTVRKDIDIANEQVDSYAKKPRLALSGIPVQRLPLDRVGGLVLDAIEPSIRDGRRGIVLNVMTQYFGFLCPYWLLEYRRVQSWRFAAGVGRALRPARCLTGAKLSRIEGTYAAIVYAIGLVAGLTVPLSILRGVQHRATRVARWVGDRTAVRPSLMEP